MQADASHDGMVRDIAAFCTCAFHLFHLSSVLYLTSPPSVSQLDLDEFVALYNHVVGGDSSTTPTATAVASGESSLQW